MITDRIVDLAVRFPSLKRADGIVAKTTPFKVDGLPVAPERSFDAIALRDWMNDGRSHGESAAARFILSVWNPIEFPFDVHDAMGVWDSAHRSAFLSWAREPWWA